jgi:hypothetical protein
MRAIVKTTAGPFMSVRDVTVAVVLTLGLAQATW